MLLSVVEAYAICYPSQVRMIPRVHLRRKLLLLAAKLAETELWARTTQGLGSFYLAWTCKLAIFYYTALYYIVHFIILYTILYYTILSYPILCYARLG